MEANKQIDLGTFTLYDSTPIIVKDRNFEDAITERLVANIHHIFSEAVNVKKQEISALESLPQEQQIHDFQKSQLYFKLPQPSILFPRSKRLPTKRMQTKWQKFAKEKGISGKKKTGLKYDKISKKMMGRWGAKSRNNFEPAIMEEKQAGRNPFEDERNKKKLKKQNEKLKNLKNRQYRQQHQ